MRTPDRISYLAQRARLGQSLFAEDQLGDVIGADYWIARNGWRHLTKLVRDVDGQPVEIAYPHPQQDPARLRTCSAKKKYRDEHLEAIRRRDKLRKRKTRDQRKAERRRRRAGGPRTGKIHGRAQLGEEKLTA